MGHISSKQQAKYQAKAARDVPPLPGKGEDAVLLNLMSLLREDRSADRITSLIAGETPVLKICQLNQYVLQLQTN